MTDSNSLKHINGAKGVASIYHENLFICLNF